MEFLRIIGVDQGEKDFTLNVIFNDGACGTIDFMPLIESDTAFRSLSLLEDFHSFALVSGTIEWNPSVDISPEWIYQNMTVTRAPTGNVNIKLLREVIGVNREEFARDLGFPIDIVDSWENGKQNPEGLEAKVLAALMNYPGIYRVMAIN